MPGTGLSKGEVLSLAPSENHCFFCFFFLIAYDFKGQELGRTRGGLVSDVHGDSWASQAWGFPSRWLSQALSPCSWASLSLSLSVPTWHLILRPFPHGLGFPQHRLLLTRWLASKRQEAEVPSQLRAIPGAGTMSLVLFPAGQSHRRICSH